MVPATAKLGALQQYVSSSLEQLWSGNEDDASNAAKNLWFLIQAPQNIVPALARVAPSADLGVYIVYMEPSATTDLSRRISIAKEFVSRTLGRDESYQYPAIHCSLTGFFSVMRNGSACSKLQIIEALGIAVREFVSEEKNKQDGDVVYHMGFGKMNNRQEIIDDQLRNLNSGLTWVKVAHENSLVVPLDDSWWRQNALLSPVDGANLPEANRIQKLSKTLEKVLGLQYVKVVTRRSGQKGIKPKRADHVSILSSRNRQTPLTRPQAWRAAAFFDRMFAGLRELLWDLVVYEVEEWGNLYSPHKMRETTRITGFAIQKA